MPTNLAGDGSMSSIERPGQSWEALQKREDREAKNFICSGGKIVCCFLQVGKCWMSNWWVFYFFISIEFLIL